METDIVHFGNNVADPWDISHGPTETTANAFDLDFVVFIDEVDCTVANRKRGDLAPVLDQLHAHALTDS
jgi:hypothetical protein